jgi:hypothetical protein
MSRVSYAVMRDEPLMPGDATAGCVGSALWIDVVLDVEGLRVGV